MLFVRLDKNDGEFPANVLATVAGEAIPAGALTGILMLNEHATELILAGSLEQFAETMSGLTPADLAMPCSTAIQAAGLAAKAGPLLTAKLAVPKIVATAGADAGLVVVEAIELG